MNHLAQFTAITLLPLALLGMRCDKPINPPTPPAAGGTFSTGGSPATGGVGPVAGAAGAPAPTLCQQACANLAKLGCPEDQATCVGQCDILTSDARFGLSLSCRINAKTKTDAQKCGPASCRE